MSTRKSWMFIALLVLAGLLLAMPALLRIAAIILLLCVLEEWAVGRNA